jgi:ABC-type antimicrobial peptide transport system permease subunit
MTFRDFLDLSVGNVRRTKLRTFLTTSGVVIAIAAFTALMSFGAGNREFVTEQFRKFSLFTTMEVYARDRDRVADSVTPPPLNAQAVNRLSEIPGVELAFPFDALSVTAHVRDTAISTQARVLTVEARESRLFSAILGSAGFSSDSAHEALVTDVFVEKLNIDNGDSLVGQELILAAQTVSLDSALLAVVDTGDRAIWKRLRNIRFDSLFNERYRRKVMERELSEGLRRFVDGLMNRRLTVFDTLVIQGIVSVRGGMRTSPVLITEGTARRLTSEGYIIGSDPTDLFAAMQSGSFFLPEQASDVRSYPRVTLQLDPYVSYKPVKDSVEALGYRAFSYAEQFEEIRRFFIYYNIGLGVIGLIALVTAGLGIVNTMVMSITERRKEIGILKSLGADERHVRLLFIMESGLIGAAGAVAGIFLGWLATRIISAIVQVIMARRDMPVFEPFALPIWLIVLAFLFGVVVAIIAGLYPAARAARVDPVESLRAE